MGNKCKLNECSLNINFCSFNNNNILNWNISQTSILNNNSSLHKGGVGNLELKDSNQEEDLVEEEAKLYVIIVGIQDIFPEISKVLQKIIHVVKNFITLSNNVHSLLHNGRLELSSTPTQCRIGIQTPIRISKLFLSNQDNPTLL